MNNKKPWLAFYGHVPESLDYPRVTMYEAVMMTVNRYPDAIAYDFLGYTSTYREFGKEIDHCANALASLGLKKGEHTNISVYDAPNMEAMLKFSMEPEVMAWLSYNTTEMKPVMTLEETMKLLK